MTNTLPRVVISGLGIVSCQGNNKEAVAEKLRKGESGISFQQDYADVGMKCHVAGVPTIDLKEHIDRKLFRFMGDAAAYSYIAMQQAIDDAGLSPELVSNPRTGIIAGSGGAASSSQVEAADIMRERGMKRMGPYRVTHTMANTVSANLSTAFKIKGINYSITSACSTSAHCIGNAVEQIQLGKQDIVFAGGGEEVHWTLSSMFDAMGAMSRKYNETPTKASRTFDQDRDGFVIAGGAGMVVVESLDHALARGAKIYAEVVGYGATSDGADMVAPSGEGAVRCMQTALSTVEGDIDYVNVHGTSTPAGDVTELNAIKQVFGSKLPNISATKAMTGHSLGAAGVQETIYCLLMLENDFIAPSINIENLDTGAQEFPIVQSTIENAKLTQVMTNSFGFGGTNASLVLKKY